MGGGFCVLTSDLLMYTLILIVKPIIRARMIAPREETLHFVLVQIARADVGVKILVKVIIYTALAVGDLFFAGEFLVFRGDRLLSIDSISQKLHHCKKDFVKKALL